METKLFGYTMRVELVILCLIIGAFIGANLLCSCSGGIREGFKMGTGMMGAALDYSMSGQKYNDNYNSSSWYAPLEGNTQGIKPPLPEGELDIFADNVSDPSCCPSTYTTSTGCVCATPEQMKYLNQRGGNRTLSSIY